MFRVQGLVYRVGIPTGSAQVIHSLIFNKVDYVIWHAIAISISKPINMKPLLQSLSGMLRPGMALTRNEVIRRYRMVKGCNQKLLQWLYMLQFTQLVKTESGEIILE